MTLLQQITHQLNAELDRLQAIRTIVAGLATPSDRSAAAVPEPTLQYVAELPSDPPPSRPRRPSSRARSSPSQPQKPVDARALTNSVPAGPVVVSAQQLAQERERRVVVKPTSAQVDDVSVPDDTALNALTRDLSARWLSGTLRTA